MASDLSSGCTEANELFDDEKEEGEISLEDVSSSEEGPPFRYQPRVFGQCPHCRSTGHCHTWCKNMTLNTKIFVRDAGKENRRHHHHHHHRGHRQQHHAQHHRAPTTATAVGPFGEDLQPISSDDDLELVGLAKKKKARKKKRRKRSPSFSISPECVVDLAIKDSIHQPLPPPPQPRRQSPVRRKPPPPSSQLAKSSSPPLTRKPSPQRMKKLRKPTGGESPLQSRGTVTKLLKKVKKLEPFSSRSKEKRTSLKDKLSNIIGGKKSDEEETVVVVAESKPKDKSPEVERREVVKNPPDVQHPVVEEREKPDAVVEEKEVVVVEEKKREDEVAKKPDASPKSVAPEPTSESVDKPQPPPEPEPAKEEPRPQEPDEDLQLRVIALRSAVLKKHRTRIARAKKKQEEEQQQQQQQQQQQPVPRIESPFTSSFNQDFPLLAEICNPGSPDPQRDDIYCPEDMELDSDMELDNEIATVLSGAEERANVLDGDAPYSPTDDLGSPQRRQTTLDQQQQQQQPMDLSMYTPSKPTETTMLATEGGKSDTADGSIFESRPYSPSDATIYDPELPGVLNPRAVPPPLQPPPMPPPPPPPPLAMMPMMPMNHLLAPFPMLPLGAGFPPVNPMLTAAPFIPFAPPTTTTNVATQLMEEFGETDLDGSPLVPIEPKDANWKFIGEPLYLPDVSKLAMPSLVPAPVLKCNKQLQRSPPPVKRPSESLFRNADMRPVAIEEESKASGATFKPIKLPTPAKKAVTTQPAAAFDASTDELTDSQKQIWPELEQDLRELEELEEQENRRRQELEEKKKLEAEERKKQEQREAEERRKQEQREAEESERRRKQESEERRRHEKDEAERRKKREREEADRRRRRALRRLRQKSVTPAPRTRRRCARTPSRAREIYSRHKSSQSSRDDSDSRSKSKRTDSKEKPERTRKLSIDDDEQALREILLASLAKRKPNAKRKAALEAAKRKAALEAAKTTSDKENVAEKPVESTVAAAAAEIEKETATLDVPRTIPPNDTQVSVPFPLGSLPSLLMPALLQHQAALKRPASAPLETQPHRKVVKRLTVVTANRAANNVKRYQNLLLQRKLTQQKLALYKTRFAVSNAQPRPQSPQVMLPPSESPRFVISLNEDTESEPEDRETSPAKSRPVLAIPTSDFEQSVDMFLKGVRLQQELLTTTTTTTTALSRIVTPPTVAQASSSATSKTLTATTSVPAVAVATPAVAKVTAAAIAAPKIATTPAATSLPKERTVLNIPKPKPTASLLSSISATPQAVKHLPVSQQEEYRRLKQQLYEYEQLRLQKAKESATATSTTTAKPVNTSSSPITPLSSPTILATSTPKAQGAKPIPKTQLIATISPMSKPSSVTPVVVTPTKIVHATSNVATKTTAPTVNKVASSSSIVVPSSSKPVVVSSAAKVDQPDPKHLNLLSKITESLNSQKTLLNSAANKISSLRVLTMEQINRKSTQIQRKNNKCVAMDDLNKTGENDAVKEKSSGGKRIVGEETSKESKMEKGGATKESGKEAKDEDNPKQTWEDFRQVVNDEVQTLSNLSTEKQKNLLAETEEKLISKRHAVLDDITEMSGSLRQWEVERDLQNIVTAEIISLREQLRLAEEKLQGQKMKLQKIQPKVTLYQKKINVGRKECFRLSKICNGLGQQIVGSGYIVPTAGAELLNNRIKEVATHTQKLCGKKTLSVQSNNSAKTARSHKNNSKANVNTNLGVKGFKRKQTKVVDTETDKSGSISEKSSAVKEKPSDSDAGAVVSSVTKTPNARNIFNTKINEQPMDVDNENPSTNGSVAVSSEESTKNPQGTNLNAEQNQTTSTVQLAESEIVSKKVQNYNSTETISVAVNNAAVALGTETDNQCDSNTTNIISDNGVETNGTVNTNNGAAISNVETLEESSSVVTNTVGNDAEASNMEIVDEADRMSKNEVSNNDTKTITRGSSNESEIVNDIGETPSVAMVEESNNNTNETINNMEVTTEKTVEKLEGNATNEIAPDTAISNMAEANTESEGQIINNSAEDVEKEIDAVAENETSPVVQAEQLENPVETDSEKQLETTDAIVQSESEKVADAIDTSNSTLNNAFEDAPDKMEIENVSTNIDETRTNEQSTNSGPTIVITEYVESDSVNTSSVVNTSLDDYMKEMTVSDEYDNMCSKDDKSSASVTSADHSTTFEEEIRLLELASESDAPHELANAAKPEPETVDECQSVAKAEQEPADECQIVAKAEQEPVNDCESRETVKREIDSEPVVKTEQHATVESTTESLPKKSSKKAFRPYESILKLVRAPRNEEYNGILCPFALMGTCIDGDCQYIHQPASQ